MTPFYECDGITLFNADWRDVLPHLALEPSQTVVVTDPPYGTGGWRRTVAGAGSNPSGSLVRESRDDGDVDWLRVASLSADAVLTFWPAARTLPLLVAANKHGLTKHRSLYMRKRDPKPLPNGRMKWAIEPIWALSADGFVLMGGEDWLEVSTPRLGRDSDATGHPYQKPIDIMRWLLAKTDRPLVVDPFCGSWTTLRAAKDLGRRAIGVELDEHWCEVTADRLRQQVLPFGSPND